MQAVSWQTIDGEFTKNSLAAFDSLKEAKEVTTQLNRRLGPGSNYRWHVAELKEVTP